MILFFVAKEIYLWINPFKDEDGVSHKGHVLGALAGNGFGYLVIYYWDDSHLKDFKKWIVGEKFAGRGPGGGGSFTVL